MIYRKPSSQPRKLLLRVAAPAGVVAVFGTAAACSSPARISGFVVTPPEDAATDRGVVGDEAVTMGFVCDPCGVASNPPDSSADAGSDVWVGGGVTGLGPYPGDGGDAESDSSTIVTGVVVHPGDAGDQ
jgi:hypothetical protein